MSIKKQSARRSNAPARKSGSAGNTGKTVTNQSAEAAEAGTPSRDELFEQCGELAQASSVLEEFGHELRRCGVVGPLDNFKLLLLAMVTRFSNSPASIVLKAPAAAGKSFTLDTVLKYVPKSAYEFISGMSEKAIIYRQVDLSHKMLCIGEYAGLQSEAGNQWLRQLLTEHRLVYSVTGEDHGEGRKADVKVVNGPVGLIMTTTQAQLHKEDETRLISLHVDDSPEQTAAVFRTQALKAQGIKGIEPNTAPWLALHEWIAAGVTQVRAPFFVELAARVDPSQGRMKRDFPKVLELVKAHALLHQANRAVDEEGCVVATLDDYEAIYHLIKEPLAEGQIETLDPGLNEVVSAVSVLSNLPAHRSGVSQKDIVAYLEQQAGSTRPDKSVVSRRVKKGLDQAYLVSPPVGPGKPQKLQIGKPRDRLVEVLPSPESLKSILPG